MFGIETTRDIILFVASLAAGLLIWWFITRPLINRYMAHRARRKLRDLAVLDNTNIAEFERNNAEATKIFNDILHGANVSSDGIMFKPILYLQGFSREGKGILHVDYEDFTGLPTRMQTFIFDAVKTYGTPIIAIGGSATEVIKLHCSDEEWQERFHDVAHSVNVIVMRPFLSPGVVYELCYLLDHFAEKLIIIMDPIDTNFDGNVTKIELEESWFNYKGERINPEIVWQRVAEAVRGQVTFPGYCNEGGLVTTYQDGTGALAAEYHSLNKETIVRLVEKRGGFIQKFAQVTAIFPAADNAQPLLFPHSVPVYDASASEGDAIATLRAYFASSKFVEDMQALLPAGSPEEKFKAFMDDIAACELRFDRWIERDDPEWPDSVDKKEKVLDL